MIDFALLNQDELYKYGAGDADATRRLFFIFFEKLKAEELDQYFASPVMELAKNLVLSEIHGVRVDRAKIVELTELVSESRDFYLDKMRIGLLNPTFNPRSVKNVREVLFGVFKMDWLVVTSGGEASTSKDAIEEVKKLNSTNKKGLEFIDNLTNYRRLEKLMTSYLNKIPVFCDSDNYVHPRLLPAGTVSGRVTSKDPALTTLPKDDKYKTSSGEKLISLKSMFIPSPDSVWIHIDFSQIELVLSAFLSKDPVMMEAYRNGVDIHDLTMRTMFGTDYISKEEARNSSVQAAEREIQRRDAKTVNFSIIYRAEPFNTAKKLGYPTEKVQYVMDKMFQTYKGLKKYLDEVPRIVERDGYLRTPFGRVRHFPDFEFGDSEKAKSHRDRQAINNNPQSCCAEITFRTFNRCCKRFRELGIKSIPLNMVYDSIDFDVPLKDLDVSKAIIIEEAARPVPQFDNFSFPFELGVGSTWAEAEENTEKIISS